MRSTEIIIINAKVWWEDSSWHLFWRSPISTPFLFISRNAMRTLRWCHCMFCYFCK